MERDEIKETFRYHSPNPESIKAHETIRAKIIDLTCEIADMIPDCTQRDLFIQHMQYGQMMANAAIAIHGRRPDTQEPTHDVS